MTILTMPAQPGQDTGAEPRAVPWQGMLWVTWRQHRGLLISVPATFIVAVIVMLIEGPKIHHDYATLMACRPMASPACQQLSNYFNSTDWHEGNGVHVALLAVPVLLAMFAGPPILARELENGTFRYAWTQGIGRLRWTVAKLTFLGAMVTILAFVISQLFTWFFAPFLTTENMTVLSPSVFDARGVSYAAWTLTAFCMGAFLGMLVRRILPAMVACHARRIPRPRRGDLVLPAQPLPGQHVLAHAVLRGRLAPDPVGAAHRRHRLAGPPPRRLASLGPSPAVAAPRCCTKMRNGQLHDRNRPLMR